MTNIDFGIKLKVKDIKDFLHCAQKQGKLDSMPCGMRDMKIHSVRRLGTGVNPTYNLRLSYPDKGGFKKLELVLKLYQDKDRCQKIHKTLRILQKSNISVPKVLFSEYENEVLGYPFLVFEKLEDKSLLDFLNVVDERKANNIIEDFAESLIFLHELNWRDLELDFLPHPKDKWTYVKKQALWKEEIPDYVNKTGLKQFTKWLKFNARFPCEVTSLLRVDMSLRNFLISKDMKISMLDWEWAQIGDPLKDVAHAYHNIRHAFGPRNIDHKGARLSLHFLRHYIKKTSMKVDLNALRFYLFSAALREYVWLRHVEENLKYPSFTRRLYGGIYVLLTPFVWWRDRGRCKQLKRFLERELDYEEIMFETPGEKILSKMEIDDIMGLLGFSNESKSILDIGTGSGRVARRIIDSMGVRIVGIDATRSAIESASKRRGKRSEYELLVADGQHLPFKSNCFDAVLCIRALKYFPNYDLGIAEMNRVVKKSCSVLVDLSNVLGYEMILRYITHSTSARGSHVFNPYTMNRLFENNGLRLVASVPLQIIPQKIWESSNPTILRCLMTCEHILKKITPLILSRSVLVKCIKLVPTSARAIRQI